VETGQLMLARSDDDGVTWSEPINVTRQVKDPAWRFVLQGPGKGITLRDGTLVFPAQYRSPDASPAAGRPFSTLIWSSDRGETWTIGTGVKVDTTEAQVVELGDGTLMINCRDNRRGSRSVYTTRDLGVTWSVHPTSRSALPEPTCMASLIRLEHEELGPLLVFSNPATRDGRRDMTLKVSRDEGRTWPTRWHSLYDQRAGFGYSCLTRIDGEHVGVLYEGRRELYFLRVPLRELLGLE
jgi:sialidase-1